MLQPKAKLKKKLKAQLIKTAAENKIEKSAKKTVCLKGQTLIQNKPSISEGYFSASLEKSLILRAFLESISFYVLHRLLKFP